MWDMVVLQLVELVEKPVKNEPGKRVMGPAQE